MRRRSVIHSIATALLLLALQLPAKGQLQTSTLYFMNLPQNHLLNPALTPTNSFYLGLPGITGVGINFNTNLVNLSDLFRHTANGDSLISLLHPDFDKAAFLNKVKNANYIAPGIGIQTFGLGFRAGKDLYIFIDINDRIEGGAAIPGDLFQLALEGNESFVGNKIDLSPLNLNMMWYREYGIGFSKEFTPRLRIGARAKMITGIAGLSVDNRDTGIEILDDYSHRLRTDMRINISGPVNLILDENNNIDSVAVNEARFEEASFYLNTKNMGFGLDLGAVYSLTPRIELSAAVNGFGFINWKSEVSNISANNEFTFAGFDISGLIDGTVENFDVLAEELLDSLKNSFVVEDHSDPFRTFTPGNISLGASYKLTESVSIGMLSNTLFHEGRVRTAMMLSANANLGSTFSAGVNYTAINQSFNNLGAGFSLRLGPMQLYTIADRIPVFWNRLIPPGENAPELYLPNNWNTFSLRVGMNLVFGNRIKKRSDTPMIINPEPVL